MSGDWRATGHSDGTDAVAKVLQEEVEEFTLNVQGDGRVIGYPTFKLARREDVFRLTGSVKADSRGLRLEMWQEYPASGYPGVTRAGVPLPWDSTLGLGSVTRWSARVGLDGTTLTHGKWSGSCAGTFIAERVCHSVPTEDVEDDLERRLKALGDDPLLGGPPMLDPSALQEDPSADSPRQRAAPIAVQDCPLAFCAAMAVAPRTEDPTELLRRATVALRKAVAAHESTTARGYDGYNLPTIYMYREGVACLRSAYKRAYCLLFPRDFLRSRSYP
jgi:hypothetical protein